jgi:hypothetical protein
MLEDLKKGIDRDSEINAAIKNAAHLFCPAYRILKIKRKDPCQSCHKDAARVVMAFFAQLPSGPVTETEVRPVAKAVVNMP